VIGCGYLGAVHAAVMASIGHDVIGVDVDELVPHLKPGDVVAGKSTVRSAPPRRWRSASSRPA
jgi:UDP-glucose 6-dehydrogenase